MFRKKSSILVKISEKCGFFSEISKKFLFCEIFEKISILVKIYERHRFFREFGKISILSNFRKNFDFGQNWRKFRKMSILVKFSKNFSRFWS